MNNVLIQKLKGVLVSLEDKLAENRFFFRDIQIEYIKRDKAAPSVAKARIYFDGSDNLLIEYRKNIRSIDIEGMTEAIIENCRDTDDILVVYTERGNEITVWTEKDSVKIKYKDIATSAAAHDDVSVRSNREYLVKAGEANVVLKEIGIMSAEGKVRNDMIRKYNQIDHFVELVDGILKELSHKESITILDCACGKSYLSFVLNYYIKEKLKKNCYFVGLDISEQVIASSKKMAANLGYKNMEFHQINIQNYMPEREIDIVISLHGCDTATDMAIAAGIRYNSEAIIVIPCCQKEILNQYSYEPFKEVLKHGILKARIADALTDGIRGLILEAMGYEVSIVEYISPLDTPKNLMIRAIKKGSRNRKVYEEYLMLKEALGIEPTLARLINI
ncbi:MAG: class I SAM-dependent methyltransferase [Bacillota bacterium]